MAEPRLIIIGGGDFGRDMARVAAEIPAGARSWGTVGGFLDDDPAGSAARMRAAQLDLPILGSARSYVPQEEDRFICGIASTRTKLELCMQLRSRGAVFTNLIDPTANIAATARLGEGVFLWRNVVIGPCAILGDFVTVQLFSSIAHDAVLGDGCTVSSFCDVMGHARLERGVFLGSHASILPTAKVGEFAKVGAGSVVLKRVKDGTTVFGVPAKALEFS